MQTLKDKWKTFGYIFLDPWVLLFLASTVFLFIYKSNIISTTPSTSIIIITLVITLSSAVLGGRITKQWIDISEGSVLVARGRSAVRSLKLLLSSIFSLERSVKYYIYQNNDNKLKTDNLDLLFTELGERCKILSEETVSSIENWTDIIPEADVKTHIGIISDLKTKLDNTEKELKQIAFEKDEIKGEEEKERRKLEEKVRIKEREAANLREELRQKEIGFGINVGSQAATLGTYQPGILINRDTHGGTYISTPDKGVITDTVGDHNVNE